MPIRAGWRSLSLVLLPCTLFAQDAPRRLIGFVAGVNRSTIGGDDGKSAGYEVQSGMTLGLQAQKLERNGQTFFRGSILFSQRGGQQDGGGGSGFHLNLSYLEVPVVLGFNIFNEGMPIRPHVLAGFQGALKLGCSFSFYSPGSPTQTPDCTGGSINYKTSAFDFAFLTGAGINVPLRRGTVTFSALYNKGLKSIDAANSPPSETYNRGWGFTLGFLRTRWR